jgi:two-component sensor histidine kinase/tetratricopeptide (TPR) repeat protein
MTVPHELAMATMGVAKTQYYRGNYRFAIRNFIEAVTLAEKENFKDIESEAAEYLGLLYNAFQNFSSGVKYFKQSLEIKTRTGDARGVIRDASKLSDIYYNRRKFDSAFYYSNVALEGAESLNLVTDLYQARLSKTAALIRLHQWDGAKNELQQLGKVATNKADLNFYVRYKVLQGNFYLSQNDYEKGKPFYDSAMTRAEASAFPELYAIIYRNMAESYYELNDYKKAYEYYQQYNQSLGELMSGENARNLGNMETLFDADKSKGEIKLLNTENKLRQFQLRHELEMREGLERENSLMDSILRQEKTLSNALSRENNYKSAQLENEKKLSSVEAVKLNDEKRLRWSLLAGLAIVLMLGSIIFYQYRRQQKKRGIIEKQSEELQILMKEIHHRVKNNLQVISSLLDLQSLTIKDSQAAEAVKEGKNRVQSMALIHQNLYNEGNIRGIQMENYINNLAGSLFHSYNIEPDKVKMKTSIEKLNLDVDTVIPIGLILNELITNSLKYAFKDKDHGEIEVLLKKENDNSLLLKVKDNGKGFADTGNIPGSGSFGMKMINAFAQKLKAKVNIYNENGACVEMYINRYKTA